MKLAIIYFFFSIGWYGSSFNLWELPESFSRAGKKRIQLLAGGNGHVCLKMKKKKKKRHNRIVIRLFNAFVHSFAVSVSNVVSQNCMSVHDLCMFTKQAHASAVEVFGQLECLVEGEVMVISAANVVFSCAQHSVLFCNKADRRLTIDLEKEILRAACAARRMRRRGETMGCFAVDRREVQRPAAVRVRALAVTWRLNSGSER